MTAASLLPEAHKLAAMSAPRECPKCLRLRRGLPEKHARCCPRCLRWQYLYQATFAEFPGAVFKHLACLACGQAAWCRDMLEGVEGQDAGACAYRTHVHGPGECSSR